MTSVRREHECDFPDTCPVCRGPVRTDPEPVTVEARFAARFPGDCPACHLGIHEGEMPIGARILHVGAQGDEVCVWALVNPSHGTEYRRIDAYGTGHDVPLDPGRYLGTAQMDNGLVFHLFDGDENGSEATP
jgi:hypothetical protein